MRPFDCWTAMTSIHVVTRASRGAMLGYALLVAALANPVVQSTTAQEWIATTELPADTTPTADIQWTAPVQSSVEDEPQSIERLASPEPHAVEAVEHELSQHGDGSYGLDEPSQHLSDAAHGTCQSCETAEGCHGVSKAPGHPAKPKRKLPGDIDEGDCPSRRYRMSDCERSGDPRCVYRWAVPSITDKYSAWYVGGGAWFKGRGRTSEEGTWGLDYDGLFGHARTWLNYTCGNQFNGGEGAYETDHVKLEKKLH